MAFIPRLLALTALRSPLLRVVVPSVATAFAIQSVVAAPSIAVQSERFFDASGSLTFLAAGALSLALPALRAHTAESAAASAAAGLPRLLPSGLWAPFTSAAGAAPWNWRQVFLTGAVAVWALRLGSYLFQRILSDGRDARFDDIRHSPPKFALAFLGQAVWVSLCLMPVLALNAVPKVAFAAVPRLLPTDLLGLGLWLAGFALEVAADRQKARWLREKREKLHDEPFMTRGLFSKSRFPNYFGEITLWTGMATTAAGVLARRPVQLSLGLSGGLTGRLATTATCYVSPAFAALLLLKVTGVPPSESKYDKRYGGRKDYDEWKRNTPRLVPKLW